MKKPGREGKHSIWGFRAFQNCMKLLGIWRHLLLSAFPGGCLLTRCGMVLVIPVCWSKLCASGDGGSLWIPPCWQRGTMPAGIAPVVSWQSHLPSPRGGHFIKDEEFPLWQRTCFTCPLPVVALANVASSSPFPSACFLVLRSPTTPHNSRICTLNSQSCLPSPL